MSSSFSSSSSSSSNSNSNHPTVFVYDVFLSFRGEDTRRGFTSHLYRDLIGKKYRTFYDNDTLTRGKSIATELLKAIENSRSSIVVLSETYAFSTWCLTELAKIVECMESKGLIVLPIFYHVDPSHVRKQNGSAYDEAFRKHEKDPKLDSKNVQSWRNALKTVSNLAGWTVEERDIEANFIEKFIENLPRILDVQKEYHNGPQRQSRTDLPHAIFSSDHDIVLPRSEIPTWLTNKSREPSINLVLNPSIDYGDWMGLILCAVFRGKPSDHFYCQMNYLGDICKVATVRCPISESSNHMWLFYLPRDLLPIEWQNSSERLEFSFRAITTSCNSNSSGCGPCGFLLVYENDIQELNKIINKYRNEPPHQNDLYEQFSNPRDKDFSSLNRIARGNSLSSMRVKLADQQLERIAESARSLGRSG